MNSLVIVGGGITGLASAYLAAKAGVKVTVLEAADSAGGLLGTFEVGGNRLECFYHHAFTHDVELLWLLRELGIENRMEFHRGTMGVHREAPRFENPVTSISGSAPETPGMIGMPLMPKSGFTI